MSGATVKTSPERTVEIIKILSEDFRYKHDTYWKLVTRFFAAVLALAIAPFIYQKDYGYVAKIYWIFPLLALLVAIIAVVILYAEYSRMDAAGRNIQCLRDCIGYPRTDLHGGWLARARIGHIVNVAFVFLSASAISISYFVFRCVVAP